MGDSPELLELTRRLLKIIRPVLPDGHFRGVVKWVRVADTTLQLETSPEQVAPIPHEADAVLREIQKLYADPQRGRPFSIDVYYDDAESSIGGVEAVRDHRVVFDAQLREAYERVLSAEEIRPSAAEWRRELELAPRAPEHVPEWWRQLLTTPTGWEPPLPRWYNTPMPQTLEEAEALPPLAGTPAKGIEKNPGWDRIIPAIDQHILSIARGLSGPELDAIFGRQGRAAQTKAQEYLAAASAQAVASQLREFDGVTADAMLYSVTGISRTLSTRQLESPSLGKLAQERRTLGKIAWRSSGAKALLTDLQKAAEWIAFRIVMRRFGVLPAGWHRP